MFYIALYYAFFFLKLLYYSCIHCFFVHNVWFFMFVRICLDWKYLDFSWLWFLFIYHTFKRFAWGLFIHGCMLQFICRFNNIFHPCLIIYVKFEIFIWNRNALIYLLVCYGLFIYSDCMRVNLSQGLLGPLNYTQGVKQRCTLSPMLFALYIASLGKQLQNSKLGVQLSGVI